MLPMEFLRKCLDYLGPYGPDALLCFILFVVATAAVIHGVTPWFAGPVALGAYWLYAQRQGAGERHRERMKRQDVEVLELNLKKYLEQQRVKLEKDKLKALPPSNSRRNR